MKPRLQTSLSQQLVLTPQLRQALHLLQLSALELEAEINSAVESNPLLDWEEPEPLQVAAAPDAAARPAGNDEGAAGADAQRWEQEHEDWQEHGWQNHNWQEQPDGQWAGREDDNPAERIVQTDDLRDHLAWQLRLTQLSARDVGIGLALIDAIDDDGYLREPLSAIAETLRPDMVCSEDEILVVLHQIQRFDPSGVGARDLGECLSLQLALLPDDTPGKALARRLAVGPIDRLPRIGLAGVAAELDCDPEQAALALQLLRTLDPRPGAQVGALPNDTYVTPDCVIHRHQGIWRVGLADERQPRLTIHQGYEQMIRHAGASDAGYLRGRLQEARWLLKNLHQRGETLLKVVQCLVRQQSGFLEFGPQALRPLTLREVAAEIGLHESTVSRAVARKYVRTPRGTLPLRAFFASGIDTGGGGETSSIAIQDMIKRLIEAENPGKPHSDARLAEMLKAAGVPVARRTVAKYREALHIPSSHERVRLD
ncbi:RNA polymerase factor sigma-54 [Luteimonas aquatica]|uniref:RNA polymerase factor sigma-54 n=1 Tax=Luteimonas aquatica TaxID=450364 RepID=UPI001F56C5C5|nr:RNA polymerase factor sigma-54 [Luteimonas aquatica]